jgi:hypothetical protein
MDIVNDVTYIYAKFYYEILYIVGYPELTKSDNIIDLKICILRYICFTFFSNPKYKVFYMFVGQIVVYILFFPFYETHKYDFGLFFKESAITSAHVHQISTL